MSQKVKFLTAVWGERYIERFCSLSLPSFLASGNLPSLADMTELEVVIMTRSTDVSYFERNISFIKLRGICPVRFVPIDDLITTAVYGITLTLAYARPIIACGEDMLNTHFVFMNADFVLANGSLRSMARHINEGRSIVLGPSYRAIAESVEPILEPMVDSQAGVLDIAPRDLVGISLAHPHRTTVAKTVNQQAFSSTHPNQLFWQVDPNTVLGRYFLVFMLCLKPQRVMREVTCFCDYSFIPELCPFGDEVAMGDSDEFFMLELQGKTQETFMLRQGQLSYRRIAESLQEWTTAAHRRAASHNIVFHSQDIPPRLPELGHEADKTIDEIRRRLGRPKSHVNHRYWVLGVEAWKEYRQQQGLSCHVPELASYRLGPTERLILGKHRLGRYLRRQVRAFYTLRAIRRWGCFLRRIDRFITDGPKDQSQASPHWQTNRLFQELGDELEQTGARVLAVGFPGSLGATKRWVCGTRTILDAALANMGPNAERFDQVVFFPKALQVESLERHLGAILSILRTGGTVHIVADISTSPINYAYAMELVYLLGEMAGNRLKSMAIRTTGNRLLMLGDQLAQYASQRLQRYGHRSRILVAPLIAPISLLARGVIYMANTLMFNGFGMRLSRTDYIDIISLETMGLGNQVPDRPIDATRHTADRQLVPKLHPQLS